MAKTKFWVIGDTSYSGAASAALDQYLNSVPDEAQFIVHVGDIWSGAERSPALSKYQAVASKLLQSDKPVFIVPGDNEYNDTTNPVLALQNWTTTFNRFDENWSHSFDVSRQPERQENFSFVLDGVLYMGINLVGGRVHDAKEWATRAADDLAWVQSNLAACKDQVTCAVIFAQASPSLKGYGAFEAGFVEAAQDFESPILYLQGDLHKWQMDNPYPDAPNITRVVIGQTGSKDGKPLLVTVTDDPAHPYSFDHGFPSNAPVITGTDEPDILIGLKGANTLYGLAGDDYLDGGAGADILYGGDGNDTLIGGSGSDIIDGGSGVNTASYATSSSGVKINLATNQHSGGHAKGDSLINIQNLVGSSASDTLIGDDGSNVLDGGKGNDFLDGGSGADTLIGGAGRDTFVVDHVGDTVVELAGGGTDTILASISFNLSIGGANVENLTLTGTDSIDATGNALANIIVGNAGNNILDGGLDGPGKIIDSLKGGAGNDTYIVRDIYDKVSEKSNEGEDTVQSFISYRLGANIENLELKGSDNLKGEGNSLANHLIGNDGDNILNGMGGNDVLTGLGGADVFLFNTKLSTSKTSNVDVITDFETGKDKIWLDNAIFTKLGAGALSEGSFLSLASGSDADTSQTRIIYDQSTGQLYYDADGTGSKSPVHFATLENHPQTVAATDFFIV